MKHLVGYLLALSIPPLVSEAAINIVYDYGTTAEADITTYGSAFTKAKSFWEFQLTGYRDRGLNAPSEIRIHVDLNEIDGAGGILGSAGPTFGNFGGSFIETTEGAMTFDTADLNTMVAGGIFDAVIRHEIGHVLGFGSLWTYNGVYLEGTGQYTGEAAIAAFQIEFNQPQATYVPVELDGGPGTANGHWNMGIFLGNAETADSRDDPGDAIVYTSVNNGLRLDDELMTGYLTGDAWFSNTTLQSFYDIGYEVAFDVNGQPVPETSLYSLIFGTACLFQILKRGGRSETHPTTR